MLKHASHFSGVLAEGEILFDTHFGYLLDHLCRQKDCLLPQSPQTIDNLLALGEIMVKEATGEDFDKGLMLDPQGLNPPDTESPSISDSSIPSIYTFLGQFIDHDITARTDRNGNVTNISNPDGTARYLEPNDPDFIIENLKNGRRPHLDLDSVFGDGPSLLMGTYQTEADHFYDGDLQLKLNASGIFDLPRKTTEEVKLGKCAALIADARNDENLNLSQLHAVFLKAYNKIYNNLSAADAPNKESKYILARKLLRWAYQYIVLNDYLFQVCIPAVVEDTLYNGPYYYNLSKGTFMPLEFSVAGFRFGHSMIRQNFKVNSTSSATISELLNFKNMDVIFNKEECTLKSDWVIDWKFYAPINGTNPTNKARKIDPKIVRGLFELDRRPPTQILAKLTQRNLIRGYSLSIPTGQSVAKAMQIVPLRPEDILDNPNFLQEDKDLLTTSCFTQKTPLWFYILQEAHLHADGESLGAVGSRLVAETLVGLVKYDPNGYLSNSCHPAIICNKTTGKIDGIELPTGGRPKRIQNISDLLEYVNP